MLFKYTNIDNWLDTVVSDVKASNSNDGEILVTANWLQKAIRVMRDHICKSIHCVDPEGVAERKKQTYQKEDIMFHSQMKCGILITTTS